MIWGSFLMWMLFGSLDQVLDAGASRADYVEGAMMLFFVLIFWCLAAADPGPRKPD